MSRQLIIIIALLFYCPYFLNASPDASNTTDQLLVAVQTVAAEFDQTYDPTTDPRDPFEIVKKHYEKKHGPQGFDFQDFRYYWHELKWLCLGVTAQNWPTEQTIKHAITFSHWQDTHTILCSLIKFAYASAFATNCFYHYHNLATVAEMAQEMIESIHQPRIKSAIGDSAVIELSLVTVAACIGALTMQLIEHTCHPLLGRLAKYAACSMLPLTAPTLYCGVTNLYDYMYFNSLQKKRLENIAAILSVINDPRLPHMRLSKILELGGNSGERY